MLNRVVTGTLGFGFCLSFIVYLGVIGINFF